jgi:hypothetical protein
VAVIEAEAALSVVTPDDEIVMVEGSTMTEKYTMEGDPISAPPYPGGLKTGDNGIVLKEATPIRLVVAEALKTYVRVTGT